MVIKFGGAPDIRGGGGQRCCSTPHNALRIVRSQCQQCWECQRLGNPGWERPDWRGGGAGGQRPDQSPSGKFSAKGASFSRSVCTCNPSGARGLGGMGGWQPGLGDEVGPDSEKGPGGVGGGSAGRVGSRGCRTVPGWTRLGLRVLSRGMRPGSSSKADAESQLV